MPSASKEILFLDDISHVIGFPCILDLETSLSPRTYSPARVKRQGHQTE